MKYTPEEYLSSGYHDGDMDMDIEAHKEQLVKCRKVHPCTGECNGEIKAGEMALRETGFMDGMPVSCYTCIPCLDAWLDEINEDTEES